MRCCRQNETQVINQHRSVDQSQLDAITSARAAKKLSNAEHKRRLKEEEKNCQTSCQTRTETT